MTKGASQKQMGFISRTQMRIGIKEDFYFSNDACQIVF